MKKNLAVAMAITAGMCFAGSGQVKPAYAGYWQVVEQPYPWADGQPDDPNYQEWRTGAALRIDGI